MGTDTALSLLEAAQRVGKSKPTILRAIQSGRLSAARDEQTREWRVEPAELFRCYAPLPEGVDVTVRDGGDETSRIALASGRNSLNHRDTPTAAQLDAVKRELEQEREERARERRQLEDTLGDLRTERDRLLAVIEGQAGTVRQLTDQRAKAPRRRRWWPWGKPAEHK